MDSYAFLNAIVIKSSLPLQSFVHGWKAVYISVYESGVRRTSIMLGGPNTSLTPG